MIDTFDLEVIADKISDKCYEKMFKVPDELRQIIHKSWIAPPVAIPTEQNTTSFIIRMETYITDVGGIIIRFKTDDGRILMERALA